MSPEVLRNAITAVMLAAAMLLAGVLGLRDKRSAVVLALLALVWLTVDRSWEGPVILDINRYHGLVLADLVGLGGLVAAVWLVLRRRRP